MLTNLRHVFGIAALSSAFIMAPAITLHAESLPDMTSIPLGTSISAGNTITRHVAPQRETNISLGYFGAFDHTQFGNTTDQSSNFSSGGLISLHSTTRWWTGFALNFADGQNTQSYSNQIYSDEHVAPFARVNANTAEISAAYLIQSPKKYWGMQPFGSIGTGILVFTPTESRVAYYPGAGFCDIHDGIKSNCRYFNQTIKVSTQARLPGIFDAGVNVPLWKSRLTLRAEYRLRLYQAPGFGSRLLDTGNVTFTQMPTVSLVYKF